MKRHPSLIASLLLFSAPAYAGDGGWATVGFHAFNLAILVGILVKYGRKPIKDGLNASADRVEREIRDASALHDTAQNLLDEFEEKLSALGAERVELLEQYRSEGEAEKARLVDEGKVEAERIKREAQQGAQNEFARARTRLEAEVVDRAIDAATMAVQQTLTSADHRRLAADYLTRLEETSRA